MTCRLILIGILSTMAAACSDSNGPRPIRATAATSIVAGELSTCALTSQGAAFCWGSDSAGQLGIGDIEQLSCPSIGACEGQGGTPHLQPVAVSGGHRFAALSGGGGFMCALTQTGQPWCWGETYSSLLFRDSVPTVVASGPALSSMSAGSFHACGLTSSGAAYCWGQNSYGQLGSGDTTRRSTPVAVVGGLSFSSINVGLIHTCGITKTGAAYCWGDAGFGEVGSGPFTGTPQTAPVAVSGGIHFASISAGGGYTCGVSVDAKAYCWGLNLAGSLGDGTDSSRSAPVAIAGGITFASIATSKANFLFNTTCGLTSSGAAYCWGGGDSGQLGNSGAPICGVLGGLRYQAPCSFTPLAVGGGLAFGAISVGLHHVCGITTAGAVYCWGGNTDGQLGNGTTSSSTLPQLVSGVTAP